MAYDASFLTGSNSTPVDPISTAYHHNDQEVAELEQGHTVLLKDGDNLSLGLESFDHMNNISYELKRDCKRGATMNQAWYRILNLELKQNARRTKVAFDPLPAMESMDHLHPRELTIAMENVVTDTLKSIWESIKNMFIKAHNAIKTWYIKAWDGSVRLKKQAEALKAKAEGMSNSTPRETSFEMSGVKSLNIGGKVPAAQDIAKGVNEINNITQNMLTTNAETYNNLFNPIQKVLEEVIEQARNMKDSDASADPTAGGTKTAPTNIGEAFAGTQSGGTAKDAAGNDITVTTEQNKLLVDILAKWQGAAKTCGIDITAGNEIKDDTRWEAGKVSAYRSKNELPGSIMLVAVFPVQPTAQTIESYADFKAGFKISPEPTVDKPKELDDNGTFQTAPTAVIINICENVIPACDVFLKYKLLYDARDKATGNLMKQMEQFVSSNSNLKGAGQKHVNNTISTTVALVKKMGDGESRWSKYAMTVLNKAIVYCRTSLNQY